MSIFNTPEQTGEQQETNSADIERHQLLETARSGAHWFYWIAALSLVTSVIGLLGGRWGFFLSLGVTRVIDEFAVALVDEANINASIKVVAFVFDVLAAGVFALFGYLGARGHAWAFAVGMALYGLDALIFVVAGVSGAPPSIWIAFAFHLYALYHMYNGYRAASQLKALDAQRHTAHVPAR